MWPRIAPHYRGGTQWAVPPCVCRLVFLQPSSVRRWVCSGREGREGWLGDRRNGSVFWLAPRVRVRLRRFVFCWEVSTTTENSCQPEIAGALGRCEPRPVSRVSTHSDSPRTFHTPLVPSTQLRCAFIFRHLGMRSLRQGRAASRPIPLRVEKSDCAGDTDCGVAYVSAPLFCHPLMFSDSRREARVESPTLPHSQQSRSA
jgi:hypothetical protein